MLKDHSSTDIDSGELELPTVDVIVPVCNERPEALTGTLTACAQQTTSIHSIYIVDDGSDVPVSLPAWAKNRPDFILLRLSRNQGISAARNAAIARSTSTFLACVNTEVLPAPNWVAVCQDYLVAHPEVGACYTTTIPEHPKSLLTRWRMRFQEPKYPERTGPSPFAHGHAVFFRKAAMDAVGGYDVCFRVAHEDSDISKRLWGRGFEVHFLMVSHCISIQKDTVKSLATKQLRDSGWSSPSESSLIDLCLQLSKWTIVRAGRNIVKGRLCFLPIDVTIWGCALWIATFLKVKHSFQR
jgi:mycofactocin glycosyltransferase